MYKYVLKIIAQLFILTLCIYLIPSAFASNSIVSGSCGADLTWSYESDNTLTISGTGKMYDYISSPGDAPWYSIRSYIKSVYIEGSVESIGYNAFNGYNSLTSVIIEDGVSSINAYSFANCSNLSKVVIPASVMKMSTVSFANCSGLKSAGPINTGCNYEFGWTETIPSCAFSSLNNLSNVVIPESVTNIGHTAFFDCSKLENVIIPAGVTSINESTFYRCSSLKNIILPDGVSNIGDNAFSYCIGLENFRFPANLINIGEYAFYNCTGLINLTIPNGLENVTAHSFCNCQNLKTITIPGSVKYIGEEAFRLCKNLEWFALEGDMPTIESNAFNGEVRTTVLYSETAAGYTPDKLQDYGGSLVWKLLNEYNYTVRYDPNGGTNAPEAQTGHFKEDLILAADTPIRPDEIETYTISLDPNGGNVSKHILSASRIVSYIFNNWNTQKDGSGTNYASGDFYTESVQVTLYAQWKSTGTEDISAFLPTPEREGYTFKGWSSSKDAAEGVTGYYFSEKDITLYATWEINNYQVLYFSNGGSDTPEEQIKLYGVDLRLSSLIPIRDNDINTVCVTLNPMGGTVSQRTLFASSITEFEFTEWNTEQNGSGISYAPGDIYTGNSDMSLYAIWDSKTETSAVALPLPTYGGHSFLGWSTIINAEDVFTNYYTPEGDTTLYALWDWLKDEPDFILPASLNLIEKDAFSGCAFRYVKLSENTVEIQKNAFSDCGNLRMIYIPESTRIIDKDAFNNVDHLIMIGKEGSYAETYAKEHGFIFSPMR